MPVTETQNKITELKQFVLLKDFSDIELNELANIIEERTIPSGSYFYREHEAATAVYFIRQGSVEIFQENNEQASTFREQGKEVGELVLIGESHRAASARTREDTEVFVLPMDRLPVNLLLLSRLVNNTALVNTVKPLRTDIPTFEPSPDRIPLLQELKQFKLLQGITLEELDHLADNLTTLSLKPGDYLFHEDQRSEEIYFIRRGKFEMLKLDADGNEQRLTVKEQGMELAEMALVGNATHAASIRALEDSEVFALHTAKLPANLILLSRLVANMSKIGTDRLHVTKIKYMQSLERELAAVRMQRKIAIFFIFILSGFSITILTNYLLHTRFQTLDIYGEAFKWGFLVILVIPSVLLARAMEIPIKELGLTTRNWKKSLQEGVVASVLFTILFFSVLTVIRHYFPLPHKQQPFEIWNIPPYILHTFTQELFERGLIQSSLILFLNDRRGIKSVFLTATQFGLFHIHFGLLAVLIIFLSSLILGAFYLRHRNLIGVTLLHVTMGACGFSSGLI